MRTQLYILSTCVFLIFQLRITQTPSIPTKETTVFQNGDDGFLCYRIPAIVKAPNGDLLAFCEARRLTCSDHGDVRIGMKRSSDSGETWGKLEIVVENGNNQAAQVNDLFTQYHY